MVIPSFHVAFSLAPDSGTDRPGDHELNYSVQYTCCREHLN